MHPIAHSVYASFHEMGGAERPSHARRAVSRMLIFAGWLTLNRIGNAGEVEAGRLDRRYRDGRAGLRRRDPLGRREALGSRQTGDDLLIEAEVVDRTLD